MEKSIIAEHYSGQNIFITGATGFMGKILVEKLLRSCPKVNTIYILIRSKRGKDPNQRLEDFLNSPIFDKLRDQTNFQEILGKLIVINGDVTVENLNLSNQDEIILKNNVNTVFHMAANVRFDQPLKPVVLMNTGGTKNLLDLACGFKQLKAFIHVSTSYCHCDQVELEEKIYPAPHDPRKILDMVKWMDSDILKLLTPKLLRNAPNTYAYTKCLTEQLVAEYEDKLPLAIARPSIVVAAWKEPIPGWVDNLNGPTGILIAAGKGIIRSMHCNPDLDADLVPVDVGTNSILTIGWEIGTKEHRKIEVFNVTAVKENSISWGEALERGKKLFYENPFTVCLWYPRGSIKSSYFLHMLAVFFYHILPAYLIDFCFVLTRNKPFLVRTQKRISNGLSVLQYYTTRPWKFHNEKLEALCKKLPDIDQEIFYGIDQKVDVDSYLLNYILGARKYCVHEEPETIPRARKILKRLYYADMAAKTVIYSLFFYFFYVFASNLLLKIENPFEYNNGTLGSVNMDL